VAGCGSDEPPGKAVPALSDRLDKVDAAIQAGDYDKARAAVHQLVSDTAHAEVDGDISSDQADRILESARSVLAALPESGS
jgi:ribosomal protein S20